MPATPARQQKASADYKRMLAAGMFEKIELLCGDVVITGAGIRPYPWALDDFGQLIVLGLLEGKHVELVQGEIRSMASMSEPHALAIMQLNYAMLPHFHPGTGFHRRIQVPLALPRKTAGRRVAQAWLMGILWSPMRPLDTWSLL